MSKVTSVGTEPGIFIVILAKRASQSKKTSKLRKQKCGKSQGDWPEWEEEPEHQAGWPEVP
jgi:hypothetical protein